MPYVCYMEQSCLVTVVVLLLYGLQKAYDTWFEAADQQKPRGRALIIANIYFLQTTLTNRNGTEVDVRMLKRVFEWLNFEVDVRTNLTSQVSYTYLSITY